MLEGRPIRDVTIFIALYLAFSVLPFVFFNRDVLGDVPDLAAVDVVTVAVGGTVLLIAIAGLFLADAGVDRYNQFLLYPTDPISMLVMLAFLLAAVSWWAVPELVFVYGSGLEFDAVLAIVLVCQLPMLLLLSLLTAVGMAQE